MVIQPNGAKAFFVQRGIAGRTVWRALGNFPEMTLAEARRLAEEPLATIRAGRNPNAERRKERAAAEQERRERVLCAELWRRYEMEIIATRNRAIHRAGEAPDVGHQDRAGDRQGRRARCRRRPHPQDRARPDARPARMGGSLRARARPATSTGC